MKTKKPTMTDEEILEKWRDSSKFADYLYRHDSDTKCELKDLISRARQQGYEQGFKAGKKR